MNSQKLTVAGSGTGIKKKLLQLLGLKTRETDAAYNKEFITGSVVQLLEFAHIIETSTEPNTVLRGYKLLTSRRKGLITASDNPGFENDFMEGCSQYGNFYDNRVSPKIDILNSTDEEMEKYFFRHYKRCWLEYVTEQNIIIKESAGRNNREVKRNSLWEKFRMISDDAEWEVNDLSTFYSIKSELTGTIKNTIAWQKTDFAQN